MDCVGRPKDRKEAFYTTMLRRVGKLTPKRREPMMMEDGGETKELN